MLNRKKKKSEVCANCHFLDLWSREWERPPYMDERENIKKCNFDDVTNNTYSFKCYREVWTEGFNGEQGVNGSNEKRKEIINETPRTNFCFFWKYRPGMLFKPAEELQKRDYELEYAAKDRRRAICGLFIAAIALLANMIFNIISCASKP